MSYIPAIPPPGEELESFIDLMTPPGAVTWRALSVEMPWTVLPGGGRTRPTDAQIRELLTGAGVTGPAQPYLLGDPFTRVMVDSPREFGRNFGLPARAVEVAVEHDILGEGLGDLADRLDLTDHKLVVPGSSEVTSGDPRGARRYLHRGRRILKALGVWPWAHVDEWRPARPWHQRRGVLAELLRWHDRAWMDAAMQLAYRSRARNGAPRIRAFTVIEREACERFRVDLAGLWESGDGAKYRDQD